jgi:hypothetical protein
VRGRGECPDPAAGYPAGDLAELASAPSPAPASSCTAIVSFSQGQAIYGVPDASVDRARARRRTPPGSAPASRKLVPFDLLSIRTAAACSCAHARLLSTTCQRRKGAEVQVQKTPENPTPPRRGQCGRLVPDENCRQSLAGAWRAAFLGCPRPPTRSPRTALCGPGAASRPSVRRLSVWIDLIGMGQALAGHGPASGPASGARKRSGRTLQRPRPWWSSRNACEQFSAEMLESGQFPSRARSRAHSGVRRSPLVHWRLLTRLLHSPVVVWSWFCDIKITIPPPSRGVRSRAGSKQGVCPAPTSSHAIPAHHPGH